MSTAEERQEAAIRDEMDKGYTYGEAEDILDHDDGCHDDEAVPGCPRCDALMEE